MRRLVSHDENGKRRRDGPQETLVSTTENTVVWDDMPTVNLSGDELTAALENDAARSKDAAEPGGPEEAVPDPGSAEDTEVEQARELSTNHLQGLLEALIFASDKPMKDREVARLASAPVKQVRALLAELKAVYAHRGIVLDEVAGGWLFRTNVQFAPFVREMSADKPVRLTRAQVETLAIAAYRQPITRPEIDDIRGVDSGATLKLLLERDLVRILGKKDEPGRPLLYGTTSQFLEFFGLRSLKDLPTLKEFTELSDESRRTAEAELGDVLPEVAAAAPPAPAPPPGAAELEEDPQGATIVPPEVEGHDTLPPQAPSTADKLESLARANEPDDEDDP
jgi:segregation and condensation protein B